MNERIKAVLEEVFELESLDVTDDTSSKTVAAWDSLNNVKLIMALEREFGVSFSLDDIAVIESVGDIKRVLAAKGVSE